MQSKLDTTVFEPRNFIQGPNEKPLLLEIIKLNLFLNRMMEKTASMQVS